jgi:hypothetical protein
MQIELHTKSKTRNAFIAVASEVYLRKLKLTNSKFKVMIYSATNLVKEQGINGFVYPVSENEIFMGLDSRLKMADICLTLAHEMVHVKQYAKGQLKQITNRKGAVHYTWMGKKCEESYYDCPWELEAFSRERVLANEIVKILKS